MEKFYKELDSFIRTTYSDHFHCEWEIDSRLEMFTKEKLHIYYDDKYLRTISSRDIEHLLFLFAGGEYIEERQMYLWQKELVDILEGG